MSRSGRQSSVGTNKEKGEEIIEVSDGECSGSDYQVPRLTRTSKPRASTRKRRRTIVTEAKTESKGKGKKEKEKSSPVTRGKRTSSKGKQIKKKISSQDQEKDDSKNDTIHSHQDNITQTKPLMRYKHTHLLISAFRIMYLSKYKIAEDEELTAKKIPTKQVREIIQEWDPKLRIYERFFYCSQYQEIVQYYQLNASEIRDAKYSSSTYNRSYHELCALLRYRSKELNKYYHDEIMKSHYGKSKTDKKCRTILEGKSDRFGTTTAKLLDPPIGKRIKHVKYSENLAELSRVHRIEYPEHKSSDGLLSELQTGFQKGTYKETSAVYNSINTECLHARDLACYNGIQILRLSTQLSSTTSASFLRWLSEEFSQLAVRVEAEQKKGPELCSQLYQHKELARWIPEFEYKPITNPSSVYNTTPSSAAPDEDLVVSNDDNEGEKIDIGSDSALDSAAVSEESDDDIGGKLGNPTAGKSKSKIPSNGKQKDSTTGNPGDKSTVEGEQEDSSTGNPGGRSVISGKPLGEPPITSASGNPDARGVTGGEPVEAPGETNKIPDPKTVPSKTNEKPESRAAETPGNPSGKPDDIEKNVSNTSTTPGNPVKKKKTNVDTGIASGKPSQSSSLSLTELRRLLPGAIKNGKWLSEDGRQLFVRWLDNFFPQEIDTLAIWRAQLLVSDLRRTVSEITTDNKMLDEIHSDFIGAMTYDPINYRLSSNVQDIIVDHLFK